ncbi:MAG: 2-succinyl-5-enolpyruvyl-6-hydroxy-3-cyclohexene-carboxylate synthase [Solirubrobacterales bacterium]|jgi:2-succinyl-5-enolpyruvyl-6-hydroxy-3-cyclohexene-1-carboxylate synthase|nr:2-succinyl-5-enolpyruvyl-6-hydroxy-3-cyclohexene-carboxylate synthase [Solirubrobacterales bacterium]
MDRTNRNTALASAFTEELARCGVRTAVICPGSRSTPLALALWRESAIEAQVIVDERSAAFFALGAAQATRAPVAVLSTSGTAAANFHPAVCEADESAVPLIVLTADRPPELRGIGAGQTIDQLKLYGDAVRWFCEVGTHDADDAGVLHYRSVACRAFWTAAGDPRPGPVHLNLAWRDPLGPEPRPEDVTATSAIALTGRDGRPLTTVPPAQAPAAPALVEALVLRIGRAERGLIVAGRQTDAGAAGPIAELAAATGFPVLAEPTSQLRLGGHDRSLVISAYEPIARARPAELEPDLVIRFGEMPTCKPLRQWLAELPDAAQLAVDPTHGWNEPARIAGAIVRAHPDALCDAIVEALGERSPAGEWSEAWLSAAGAAESAVAEELAMLDEPSEPGLHRALGGAYADGDLVYTASSMPIRDQEAFLPSGDADVLFLANRGANGIDGLISSGMGAALASGRPTWIITGDLGLFHDMNALAILRGTDAPVRIVVIDNGGGGIFEFLPQAAQIERDEFEALLGTPTGIEPERVAALFGIPYVRLETLGQLSEQPPGPVLIRACTDRAANVALHERLRVAAAEALGSP